MVKGRTGPELKVVECSIQAGVDVFDKVRQLTYVTVVGRDRDDGQCPSAVEEWIRAVLDAWEQCIDLPGEILRQAIQHIQADTPAVLLGSWMLCPEPASVLAVSLRASGLDVGKTTPPPR